jgi:integral membrane sensor domain MASE1
MNENPYQSPRLPESPPMLPRPMRLSDWVIFAVTVGVVGPLLGLAVKFTLVWLGLH